MFTGFSLPAYNNNNSQRQEISQQQLLASILNYRDYQQRLQLLLCQQQFKFGTYPQVPALQGSNQGFVNRTLVFPQNLIQGNLPQTNRVTIIQPVQPENQVLKGFQPYGQSSIPAVKVEQPSELPIETVGSIPEDNFETVQIKQEYVGQEMDIQEEVTDECSESDSKDIAVKVSASKKIKKVNERAINTCGHPERKHYAKGLCNNCYHKYGRVGKPELCGHDVIYAKGLCQKCYLLNYNQQKNQASKKKRKSTKKCARKFQKQY